MRSRAFLLTLHSSTHRMNTFTDSAATAFSLITSLDPMLAGIVVRSLAVSACACAIASVCGLLLGGWIGVSGFRGRGAVLALLNTALALPSVVVGLVVYLLLSRSGPLGFLGWLFSFKAMVLAQALLVLPVVMALVRQTVEDAERQRQRQGALAGFQRDRRCHDAREAVDIAADDHHRADL